MTQHTPGPWYYHKNINAHDQGLIISETTGANVAVVYNGEDTPVLAASLDMLMALERAEQGLTGYSRWIGATSAERELINAIKLHLEHARAAIAKAKGE